MSIHRFLTLEETKEILFYDNENGVYVSGGEVLIEKELDKIFGFKLRTSDITEIKNYVMRKTYVKKGRSTLILILSISKMDCTTGGQVNSCLILQIIIP